MRPRHLATTFALLTVTASLPAAELARVDDLDPDEVESRVFAMTEEQEVTVEAVAFRRSNMRDLSAAWILDAATRHTVWELRDAAEGERRGNLATFSDSVRLDPGEYELYLSTYGPRPEPDGIGEWVSEILRELLDPDDLEDELARMEVRVEGQGEDRGSNPSRRVGELLARGAAISFSCVGDEQLKSRGFAVSEPLDLHVYALGEMLEERAADTAWIIRADTRARVWQLEKANSSAAGGASKNRVFDGVLRVEAGRYVAFFATDDSHSCAELNAPPPHDPWAWGLTIRAENPADADRIETFAYQDILDRNLIAHMTGVEDDEHRSHAFTLKRPTRVLVYALGEGTEGEMHDYGWIVDARTHDVVWEMRYRGTEHAGGATKNRLANEVLELPAGSYVAHFVSDGSHSSDGWNAAPPFEPERWGLTMVAVDEGFSPDDVADYSPASDPTVIARIARVGDREHQHEPFDLAAATEVEIFALGEGDPDRMYDYGWIEDRRSAKVVWEMTYPATEHAGGAGKNRLFRGTLRLPAGEYELHYRSDGSHSYEDWNAPPPHDPESWGITVYLPSRDVPPAGVVEDPGGGR